MVITNLFSLYRGRKPAAWWTDIYKFNGKKYIKGSQLYPSFYKNKVADLDQKIKSTVDSLEKTVYHIEMEKAIRLIYPKNKVGYARAVKLYSSDDPDLKMDAVKIWEDIADGESLEMLNKAMKNSDQRIANEAKRAKEKIMLQQIPEKKRITP